MSDAHRESPSRRPSSVVRPALAFVLLLLGMPQCTRRSSVVPSAGEWLLVQPPDVEDASMPRGHRLLTEAPLAEWPQRGAFPSEEECAAAKRAAINGAIDHARKESGEANAKYDLDVRRAVHARCVPPDGASAADPRE